MEGVNVSFDGFKAINDLNFYVNDGELRCVIGPNGAGKTTMMDIITGKTRPDSGSVWFGQTINLTKMSWRFQRKVIVARGACCAIPFRQSSVTELKRLLLLLHCRIICLLMPVNYRMDKSSGLK